MHIIINNSSMIPIYEQIMNHIKKEIADGSLAEGAPLPSVRRLAGELKISALTVKKAYDRLEEEGFVATIHGKGTFIASQNMPLVKELQCREIETEFAKTAEKARQYGLTDEEIRELFGIIMEEST